MIRTKLNSYLLVESTNFEHTKTKSDFAKKWKCKTHVRDLIEQWKNLHPNKQNYQKIKKNRKITSSKEKNKSEVLGNNSSSQKSSVTLDNVLVFFKSGFSKTTKCCNIWVIFSEFQAPHIFKWQTTKSNHKSRYQYFSLY